MAFEDKDTSVSRSATDASRVEEVCFRRDPADHTGPPQILVTKLVEVDGQPQRVTKRVPQATVIANWPGGTRNLKNWLLLIIDNATE